MNNEINLVERKYSKRNNNVRSKIPLEKIKGYATSSIIPIVLVSIWQILSSMGIILDVVLPSPVKVVRAFLSMVSDGTLFIDLKASGIRVFTGYFWGTLLGLSLGIASGLSKFIRRLIEPLIDVMRQIPIYAWIPLFILWFGIGEVSKDVIIGKAVFVPVYVNTLQGIVGVEKKYVEVAQALELKFSKYLRKVIIPSALPSIFTGLRLGAGFSWMAVVAAEMLGGLTGLGYALLMTKDFLQSDKLIALMLVIGIIGLAVDRVIKIIENSVLHWRRGLDDNKNS